MGTHKERLQAASLEAEQLSKRVGTSVLPLGSNINRDSGGFHRFPGGKQKHPGQE
jgi:hypothetical protein